jgi:hypothetical protein
MKAIFAASLVSIIAGAPALAKPSRPSPAVKKPVVDEVSKLDLGLAYGLKTRQASGKVAAVEVNGEMPAGVDKCIAQMASRWTFPAADAPSEIDHGIMLTTTSQK